MNRTHSLRRRAKPSRTPSCNWLHAVHPGLGHADPSQTGRTQTHRALHGV